MLVVVCRWDDREKKDTASSTTGRYSMDIPYNS